VGERPISVQQYAFLKFEIDNGDAKRRKVALQEIARLYRKNFRFSSEQRNAIELTINGLVLQCRLDFKVVRWCLNVLAQLGKRGSSDRYVQHALQQYDGCPEIVAAGIAALTKMYNGRVDEIEAFSRFDPTIRVLAALQNTDPNRLDLRSFKINIETADPEILKLALITVGLNRDIENLFHPKHSNAEIIRALGQYPDKIVVQYTVWAIIENVRLSIADLGMQLLPIDAHPENVQAKLMQLVAERETDVFKRHSIVADGPFLTSVEAREGLAKGLQGVYYDGLEGVTVDWFDQEDNFGIRLLLAEHFGRFASNCGPYADKAFSIIDVESRFEERILLGAEGKHFYRVVKGRSLRHGTPDLFGDTDSVHIIRNESKQGLGMIKTVLFLAASPRNETRIRLDEEARDLKEAIRTVDDAKVNIRVTSEWAVRVNQIQASILNYRPEILHFSGHGASGALCFEDNQGNAADVSDQAFAELIELNRGYVRCVVLNACYSRSVTDLIKGYVDCVIGCESSIADDAAIAFTRAFYRALAHGESYEKAFRFGKNEVALNSMSAEADKYKFARQ